MTEPLSKLTIMVTDDCNLGCVGCVTNAQFGKLGNRTIDTDFALEAIKMLYKTNITRPYLFFSGRGEPTLRMDVIEKIVNGAKNILNDAYIGIQTNGVFDNKTRQKINEIADLVWISVDGRPEINDALRPMRQEKASEYIKENTCALLAANKPVRWRSTIYPKNRSAEEQKALIDFAKQCGIQTVVSEPAIISPSAPTKNDIYLTDIAQFIEGFISANKYAATKGITYTTGFMERKRCGECFAIDETLLPKSATLTTDNRVVACYLGFEKNKTMESLEIGKWQEGKLIIDKDSLLKLSQKYKQTNCCLGRSLLGQSKIDPLLLERLRTEAVYPEKMPYHS